MKQVNEMMTGGIIVGGKLRKLATVIPLSDTSAALKVLDGISLVDETENDTVPPRHAVIKDTVRCVNVSNRMTCVLCSIKFVNREQQVIHYKSEWHRYNLRRKLRGMHGVSEERFESIVAADAASSSSDSEADNDDPSIMPARDSRVYLCNKHGQTLSVYRCVLTPGGDNLTSECADLPLNLKWAVLMAGGGHFAAAIFDGDSIVRHKTFHRYVVRAKRGTAQSSRDRRGNAPKSGGATLRRHNEAALAQDVQSLLQSWSADLSACSRVFLRAPSFNRPIVYAGRHPTLSRSDSRVRNIPLVTGRPTLCEVKRVHRQLMSIYCYDAADTVTKTDSPDYTSQDVNKMSSTSSEESVSPNPNVSTGSTSTADFISTELHNSTEISIPELSTLYIDKCQ